MIDPVLPQDFPDLAKYVHYIRTFLSHLSPRAPDNRTSLHYVPKNIITWTHVFVRNYGIPSQLRPPYSKLYKVIQKEPKFFVLDIEGKRNTVSVDRLKRNIRRRELTFGPHRYSNIIYNFRFTRHKHLKFYTTPAHQIGKNSSMAHKILFKNFE